MDASALCFMPGLVQGRARIQSVKRRRRNPITQIFAAAHLLLYLFVSDQFNLYLRNFLIAAAAIE